MARPETQQSAKPSSAPPLLDRMRLVAWFGGQVAAQDVVAHLYVWEGGILD
jgi:hypothetical protein